MEVPNDFNELKLFKQTLKSFMALEIEQAPVLDLFWGNSEQMHECGDLYWDSNVRFT